MRDRLEDAEGALETEHQRYRTDGNRVEDGLRPLRSVLVTAANQKGCRMKALTVLSAQRDLYGLDTPAGHRDGAWFAEMVQRLVGDSSTVHLRGLHYRISSAADVRMPNGVPYTNTNESWEWLCETAAKAARWLGHVPFERIVDERKAPPQIFVPDASPLQVELTYRIE
jgi:hypothetical protein